MVKGYKCTECKYEHLSKCEHPCSVCKWKNSSLVWLYGLDYFEPKEEQQTTEYNGCDGCIYEDTEPCEEPCIVCQRNFIKGTNDFEGHIDYFKPKEDEKDIVNHPQHYVGHGIEPIEFIESHNLNFNLGSAVKYIARAPYKGKELEDLKKQSGL